MSALERRCRRLLRVYPAAYRAERGDELLATLLDATEPGRARPHLGDVVAMGAHGLRRRAAVEPDQWLGGVLASTADAGLLMAAALAVVSIVVGDWAPWAGRSMTGFRGGWGPFTTTGPACYAAWLTAGISVVLGRRRAARRWSLVGLLLAVATIPAAHVTPYGRPPLYWLATLSGLVVPMTLAPVPVGVARRRPGAAALLATGAIAAVACTATAHGTGGGLDAHMTFYRIALLRLADWVPVLVAVAVVVGVAHPRRRRAVPAVAVLAVPWLALVAGVTKMLA